MSQVLGPKTEKDYFASTSLGRSDLRGIYTDPATWKARKDGLIPQRKPTPEMVFGSALDARICGGKGPDPLDGYLVLDHESFRTKSAKQDRDNAIANGWDKESVITQAKAEKLKCESDEQLKRLDDCIEAIEKTPLAWKLLQGRKQQQFYFEFADVDLKSMPDICHDDATVDLKCSDEIGVEGFLRQAKRFWYPEQAALMQRGRMINEERLLPVVFVVVQPAPPFNVEVFGIEESIIAFGWNRINEAISRYKDCKESGVWKPPEWNELVRVEAPRYWMRNH